MAPKQKTPDVIEFDVGQVNPSLARCGRGRSDYELTSIRAQAFNMVLQRKDVLTFETQIAQADKLAHWIETGRSDG